MCISTCLVDYICSCENLSCFIFYYREIVFWSSEEFLYYRGVRFSEFRRLLCPKKKLSCLLTWNLAQEGNRTSQKPLLLRHFFSQNKFVSYPRVCNKGSHVFQSSQRRPICQGMMDHSPKLHKHYQPSLDKQDTVYNITLWQKYLLQSKHFLFSI